MVISIFEQALAHRLLWLQMGEHWDLPLGDGMMGLDESCLENTPKIQQRDIG